MHARRLGGGANAPAVATATATPGAYPLPGQPSGPSSAKTTATPTRLAAYPLPGSATPAPTASKSGGAPLSVSTTTLTYTLFLPIIRNDCYFKGTAGINATALPGDLWYTNTLAMGVCAGYEWNHVYTPGYIAYNEPWQVINDIRSRFISADPPTIPTTIVLTWNVSIDVSDYANHCPGTFGWAGPQLWDPTPGGQAALRTCIQHVAASRPGMYWLIWNEPDDGDQDYFSPAQGALFFHEISNTILSGDPTARLIIGNVLNQYRGTTPEYGCPKPDGPIRYGCGIHWLTQFISEAQALGYDPRPFIAGYGFHVYSYYGFQPATGCPLQPDAACQDAALLSNFTNTIITSANWVSVHDPGKEVWLTEINWYPNFPSSWDTQTRRMSQMCYTLLTLPINRYFWFDGGWPWTPSLVTTTLFATSTGALSPAGERFALPPDPVSGGCPVRR